MKKKLISCTMAAAMIFTMAGCGSGTKETSSASAASSASAESVKNTSSTSECVKSTSTTSSSGDESSRKKLVVGFDAEYPPYGFKDDNGEYTGFDLELAQELCDRRGWELVKQPIDWDSKDMELNSGSIDCIWNGFTMTGREDDYTFSKPYVDNSIVVVVMNDSDIKSLDDLAGKVVVTQSDSSALSALTDDSEDNQKNLKLAASFADLQQVADYNSAFMNLESGSVDAIAVDIGVARYQVNSRGDTFRMLDDPISKEQYAIGFKKGNTSLRDAVQETFDQMEADGTVKKIAEKYKDYSLPEMLIENS